MEKRRERRKQKCLRLSILETNPVVRGSSVDVSTGGMHVRLLGRTRGLPPVLRFRLRGKNRDYEMTGRVRWRRLDVLDHSMHAGIQFTAVDPNFLTDVLSKDVGAAEFPFIKAYADRKALLEDFGQNIRFGAFLINSTIQPKVGRSITAKLILEHDDEMLSIEGEVVAHLPGALGLKLDSRTVTRIEGWLSP